jgi:uncharacterized protein (TIGR02246 family)
VRTARDRLCPGAGAVDCGLAAVTGIIRHVWTGPPPADLDDTWAVSPTGELLAYGAEEGVSMDQDRITELIDKSEITSIVNSYFRALDEKNFDAQHFASIFTPQAKVTRPNGASLIGPEEISASHEKSFTRFEGSQHLVAGHDISLDGSTANVRANLIAMHMWQGSKTDANKLDNVFIAGGVIHATLIQSDGQWRISQMSNAVLWRAGGFRDMMQTGQ